MHARTSKKNYIDLLLSEGRYLLEPRPNLSAKFISQFFLSQKKLFKAYQVKT